MAQLRCVSVLPSREWGRNLQFVIGSVALCQTVHGPARADEVTLDASGIIVTARRFEEPVHAVPISITAINREDIEAAGAENLADVARSVPNLVIAPNGVLGTEQPAIRGVFSAAGSSTVGIYLDEVPVQIRSTGFSRNPDLRTFDLERVEVLRGPQGTLFGANSMGGTIRFIPRRPDFDSVNGYSRVEFADTKGGGLTRAVEGAFGVPIWGDRLAFRVGAYYRHDAGYVDQVDRSSGALLNEDIDDVSALALRAALTARPLEAVEVSPSFVFQRVRRDDYPFFDSDLGRNQQGADVRQPSTDSFVLPAMTIRVDLGSATFTSVSSYLDRDDWQLTDYSPAFGELVLGGAVPGLVPEGGSRSRTHIKQRGWTQEVRLASASADATIKWVAGAFLARSKLRLDQNVVEPGIAALSQEYLGLSVEQVFGAPLLPGGISYHGVEQVDEKQFAAFGDVRSQFLRGLEANAGVRISRSVLDLRVLSEGPYAGGSIGSPAKRTQRETPVTPRFGLSYKAGPDLLYYASVGKGFRIGGANPPVPNESCAADLAAMGRSEAPVSFNSDSLWSYEAGVKAAVAQQRLHLSLSAFSIQWKGIQQPIMLPNCGFSYVDNLGSARSRGFELEVEAHPSNGVALNAALGFVDARFTKTVEGGTRGTDSQPSIIVARGDRVPFVPRWTARLAMEYRSMLIGNLQGFVRSEYQYVSSYRRSPSMTSASYNALVYRGDSYTNLTWRAGVTQRHWQFTVFTENLLNDRSVLFSSADLVPATGSPLRQMTQRPRTLGIAASISF